MVVVIGAVEEGVNSGDLDIGMVFQNGGDAPGVVGVTSNGIPLVIHKGNYVPLQVL